MKFKVGDYIKLKSYESRPNMTNDKAYRIIGINEYTGAFTFINDQGHRDYWVNLDHFELAEDLILKQLWKD